MRLKYEKGKWEKGFRFVVCNIYLTVKGLRAFDTPSFAPFPGTFASIVLARSAYISGAVKSLGEIFDLKQIKEGKETKQKGGET